VGTAYVWATGAALKSRGPTDAVPAQTESLLVLSKHFENRIDTNWGDSQQAQ